MAGVTLMHVLVLFREKQQHGKSNPYTAETTKVIGKKKKGKQLFMGRTFIPIEFFKPILAVDRTKGDRLSGRVTGTTGYPVLMFTLTRLGR